MIYLFTFLLSVFIFQITDFFWDKKRVIAVLLLLLGILIPSILAGCRDLSIGTDTSFYVLDYFRSAKYSRNFLIYKDRVSSELGYLIFNYIITLLFQKMSWLLFFIQIFIMSFIAWAVLNLKKRNVLPWAFLIYFLLYYSNSLNMTRQTMAIAICLLSFSYLITGKIKKSLVVAAFALFFHFTAFIFLAVFPLYYFCNKFTKNFWVFQVLIGLVCVLAVLMLDNLIVLFIGSGMLAEKFDSYKSGGIFGSNIPMSDLFLCFVFLLLCLFFKKYTDYTSDKKNLFQTIFLISVILCFAAIQSTFAVRGMYYFSFQSILIIPYIMSDIQNKQLKNIMIATFCACFILYWILTIPYANLGETYPYKSKILNL